MPPTIKHNPAAASGGGDADKNALLAWLAEQVEKDPKPPADVRAAAGRVKVRHSG